jgi:hypothetical protein
MSKIFSKPSPVGLYKDGEKVGHFYSVISAARELGICHKTIHRSVDRGGIPVMRGLMAGYSFRYEDAKQFAGRRRRRMIQQIEKMDTNKPAKTDEQIEPNADMVRRYMTASKNNKRPTTSEDMSDWPTTKKILQTDSVPAGVEQIENWIRGEIEAGRLDMDEFAAMSYEDIVAMYGSSVASPDYTHRPTIPDEGTSPDYTSDEIITRPSPDHRPTIPGTPDYTQVEIAQEAQEEMSGDDEIEDEVVEFGKLFDHPSTQPPTECDDGWASIESDPWWNS